MKKPSPKQRKADCCAACGLPFVGHIGLIGTCRMLSLARDTLGYYAETPRYRRARQHARMTLACITEQIESARAAGEAISY